MLITEYYRQQNEELHRTGRFGGSGHHHAQAVLDFATQIGATTLLDYGCGQRKLAEALSGLSVSNYDPAIAEFSADPAPVDLVVCTDVLEHVEPECLKDVLAHIRSKAVKAAYFAIALRPDGKKCLPDGRNPHLLVKKPIFWETRIGVLFRVVRRSITPGREIILWANS